MQPLQLKLTAFGPYKQCEVIDFRQLGDQKLFVISGTTGAGKTTIFDGIFYALYGSASGEDRSEVKNLRSHFADDTTPTSVDLLFEMRGHTYRVYRQLPYKKAGNKSETPGKVELYEIIDGVETPIVDQQKATDVSEKIKTLLGLTKEQFKQIVMLPQGEFQKLLTSDTANKEDILRKIFKTSKYDDMVARLKEKRNAAQQSLSEAQSLQQHFIRSIEQNLPPRAESALFSYIQSPYIATKQLMQHLLAEKSFYEETLPDQQQQYEQASTAYASLRDERAKSQQFNEMLAHYETLKATKQQLQQQQQQIELLKVQRAEAEYAQTLAPYDEQYRSARATCQQLQQQHANYVQAFEKAEQALTDAKKIVVQATTAYEKRTTIEADIQRWQPLLPMYERVETLKKQARQLAETRQRETENATAIAQQYETTREQYTAQKERYEQLTVTVQQLPTVQQQLFEEQKKLDVYTEYVRAMQQAQHCTEQVKETSAALKVAQQRYEQLRTQWLANQAYVLAQELVDGEPCPVCGGVDHQRHAVAENALEDGALEAARQQLDEAQRAYYRADSTHQTTQQTVAQLQQQAQALAFDVEHYSEEALQTLKRQYETLRAQQQTAQQLYQSLKTQEQMIHQLEAQREQATRAQQEAAQQYAQNDVLLAEQLKQLPSAFETKAALEQAINERIHEKQRLEQQYETARVNASEAEKMWSIAQNNVKHSEAQLIEATHTKETLEAQFKERVLERFVDGAHYQQAQQRISQLTQLTHQIDQYNQQCYANEQALATYAHLEGKQPIDVTMIEQQLREAKIQYETLLAQYEQTKRHMTTAGQMLKEIGQNAARIEQLEARAAEVIALYDMLRGQNDRKISFERYLQIEYLEQIIEAANERLRPLSNGQFLLRRSERLETRGKQSGLGLDIYDAYTGQTRDVKTMSGGEKFNAALCLALGISDIIQSYSGQVDINTMFIDEGFGTLDDEALAKAIDTLVELQKSGRMIGVISHVSGLKEAIPAVLEVKKQREGYSHAVFKVK